MNTSKITRIILIALGTLSILALLIWFVSRFGMNTYNYPFRSGMMGSWGFMHPFSLFGMAFMWLIPIGIIVLVVLGIMSLFNGTKKTDHQHFDSTTPVQVCQNCGKNVQNEWKNCPYCGEKI
jgi:uncharacterized membrane protein